MPATDIVTVAIDGPSGTGKGTISKRLAECHGWGYLDSGALYRVFAILADEEGILPTDIDKLNNFAATLNIDFKTDSGGYHVYANGRDMTQLIREEGAGTIASKFAVIPEIRALLMGLQRDQRRAPGLVADGRDMGTTVFPDALVKIFLDARPEIRAERRYKQLKEKGFDGSLARLREEMAERDDRDANRSVSPMVMAVDAIRVDTSDMSVEEVVARVEEIVNERLGASGVNTPRE
ncbi:MAG: cytidylate kinase [marine bacterium B5-7]|nr:MAG: cytidylate kinase [marine bacterium B5-7]